LLRIRSWYHVRISDSFVQNCRGEAKPPRTPPQCLSRDNFFLIITFNITPSRYNNAALLSFPISHLH
jgi:hypothetical protein